MTEVGDQTEIQQSSANVAIALEPYVQYFARQVVAPRAQADMFQRWNAYTLAVLLYTDATGEQDRASLNRVLNEGLNSACIEEGSVRQHQVQYGPEQWRLFKRIAFGGVESTDKKLGIDLSSEDLLEGIKAGLFHHRPITELANRSS